MAKMARLALRQVLPAVFTVVGFSDGLRAAPPQPRQDDADFRDVFFIDSHFGWAVGHGGRVCHTTDGGQNWRLQTSRTQSNLESVCFVDRQHGWAVGGRIQPYTHRSQGVVLATTDGGATWNKLPPAHLPALRSIQMFDRHRGWALGDASALFPSGAFFTQDGGQTWTTIPTASMQDWQAGHFFSSGSGVICGGSRLATAGRQGVAVANTASHASAWVRDVRMLDEQFGWAAGDGGLVLATTNGGANWRPAPFPLPEAAKWMDFRAVETHGSHVWLAGAPGSCVLRSTDGGQSWQTFFTGAGATIHSLCFVDAQHGWAACAGGALLATQDGGQSWQVQQSGPERTALLGLFSRAEAVPAELFAKQCAGEGFVARIEVVTPAGNEGASLASGRMESHLCAAAHSLGVYGGEVASQFAAAPASLRLPKGAIVQNWPAQAKMPGYRRFVGHLVRLIRQWKPDAIVAPSSANATPLDKLTSEAVREACRLAADRTAFREHIVHCGLDVWQVQSVVEEASPDARQSFALHAAVFVPGVGKSLADAAADARALLAPAPLGWIGSPEKVGFLVWDPMRSDASSRHALPERAMLSSAAPRRHTAAEISQAGRLQVIAAQSRNLQRLFSSDFAASSPEAWLGQIDEMTRGWHSSVAALLLWRLAGRYHQLGKPDLAADTLQLLASRYPDEPQAEAALWRLLNYFASAEAAWQEKRGQQTPEDWGRIRRASAIVDSPPDDAPPGAVKAARFVTSSDNSRRNSKDFRGHFAQAMQIAKVLAARHPDLNVEPAVKLTLAAVFRAQGLTGEAHRLLHQVAALPDVRWRTTTRGELWLAQPGPASPRPWAKCGAARTKPHLDGILDEPWWSQAGRITLETAADQGQLPKSEMRVAGDKEFLYLAMRCPWPSDPPSDQESPTRKRDVDLSDEDRVEIFLDVNRDFATGYRLVIDRRGWIKDACLKDSDWNPQWFVASRDDAQGWTVEAAIPWSELAPSSPSHSDVWAVKTRRIIPGVGYQQWSRTDDGRSIEGGFGYLMFGN